MQTSLPPVKRLISRDTQFIKLSRCFKLPIPTEATIYKIFTLNFL